MRKKWAATCLLIGIIITVLVFPTGSHLVQRVQTVAPSDTILLDPGHGGIDGGAVSASGVSEKDINLAIALYVKELAEVDGWNVVMTRDVDKGLYTGVENDGTDQAERDRGRSIRSLKTEDLKERIAMIERVEPMLAVSIHLNSFKEDRSVRGAQSFYPSKGEEEVVEESKKLAETIQACLVAGIDDGTDRAVMGKSDVMMMKNPVVPIVIVECGFLSNKEEESLLQTEEYQRELAKYIYEGIMEFTGKEGRTPVEIVDNRG